MAAVPADFLASKLVSLIENEAALLGSARDDFDEIKREVVGMRSFLEDADKKSHQTEGEKTWVASVRDLIYDVEDIIDEFLYHTAKRQGRHNVSGKVFKTIGFAKQLWEKHQIASRLQQIKATIKTIPERSQRYGVDHIVGSSNASYSGVVHGESSLFIEDDELLGIEDERELLVGWLTNRERSRATISVVGMGGSGKTTLVAKAYSCQNVKHHFDCYAWLTVSQTYVVEDLFRSLIKQFFKENIPAELSSMSYQQLVEMLVDYLESKRYLVVLDDVWCSNLWSRIKVSLPNGYLGSRVMLTTRNEGVASLFCEVGSHMHHIRALSENEAWDLFCLKASQFEKPILEKANLSKMETKLFNWEDAALINRFNKFLICKFVPSRFIDFEPLEKLGMAEEIRDMVNCMGLEKFVAIRKPTFYEYTMQFITTFVVVTDSESPKENEYKFSLGTSSANVYNLDEFNYHCGFVDEADLESPNYQSAVCDHDPEFDAKAFWKEIAEDKKPFKSSESKSNNIKVPAMRYLQRYFAYSLLGRGSNQSSVSTNELLLLWCAANRKRINVGYWFGEHVSAIVPKQGAGLLMGSYITQLAENIKAFSPVLHKKELSEELPMTPFDIFMMGKINICLKDEESGEYKPIDNSSAKAKAEREGLPKRTKKKLVPLKVKLEPGSSFHTPQEQTLLGSEKDITVEDLRALTRDQYDALIVDLFNKCKRVGEQSGASTQGNPASEAASKPKNTGKALLFEEEEEVETSDYGSSEESSPYQDFKVEPSKKGLESVLKSSSTEDFEEKYSAN